MHTQSGGHLLLEVGSGLGSQQLDVAGDHAVAIVLRLSLRDTVRMNVCMYVCVCTVCMCMCVCMYCVYVCMYLYS